MEQKPLGQKKKSPKFLLFYILVIMVVQACLHTVIFPLFVHESMQFLKIVTVLSFAVLGVTGFLTWCKGPRFIIKQKDMAMSDLLENIEASSICFDCQVINQENSYHCNVCEKCVDGYEFHCTWLNTCIGKRNHTYFVAFVSFHTIYLLAIMTQIIGFFITSEAKDVLVVYLMSLLLCMATAFLSGLLFVIGK